jgi:hypothetical protein
MNRRRPAAFAVLLGMLLAIAISAPASAFLIAAESGQRGDWGWNPSDDSDTPGGRCGYSAENASGDAFLRWIRIRPPLILARDTTAAQNSQKASWQVVVQRKIGDGQWRKVAESGRQTRTTWDDHSGDFDPIKVYVNGQANQTFRGIVFLRWLRNGAVEGSVKLVTEYYGVKWTVGTPDYVFEFACDGASD